MKKSKVVRLEDEAPKGGEEAIRAAAAAAEVVEFEDHQPGGAGRGGDDVTRKCAASALNDVGNGKRLIRRYGDRLIYVEGLGWLAWEGSRWSVEDGERRAQQWAHWTARRIGDEAGVLAEDGPLAGESTEDFDKRVARRVGWACTSGMTPRIKGMLDQAQPYLTKAAADLDARPWVFGCANGALDLRDSDPDDRTVGGTWEFRPHRREDWLTMVSPVEYDPEAEAPRWRRFVAELMPDHEKAMFLQRWVGYVLTGDVSEQLLLLNYGTGSNGKSTFFDVLKILLGGYAVGTPFETFTANDHRRGSEATPDLVRLVGRRAVMTSEPENGSRLGEGMIKRLTGGEVMVARQLNQPFIEFTPAFKLMLSFNQKPSVRGQDHGIWRRLALLGWDQVFVDPWEADKFPGRPLKDKGLKEALQRELPGILNWCLEGFREWRKAGIAVPDTVRAATDEYRTDSNPLGQFLDACTQRGGRTQAKTLYDAYCAWCRREAVDPLSSTAFGRRLSDMGVTKEKVGTVFWGVEITDGDLLASHAPRSGGGDDD